MRWCAPPSYGLCVPLSHACSQVPRNPALTLSGTVTVNGAPASASKHAQAYVQQDDVFYSQLTVLEVRRLMIGQVMVDDWSSDGCFNCFNGAHVRCNASLLRRLRGQWQLA